DTAVPKERRRASRELERRPCVSDKIRRGLVATPVEDPETPLRIHHPPHRLVERRGGQRTGSNRIGDEAVPLELGALIEAEKEVVRARLERAQTSRGLADVLYRSHLEVVRPD